jgi:hypothetical protein
MQGCVGAQWELPGARVSPRFPSQSGPVDGHSVRTEALHALFPATSKRQPSGGTTRLVARHPDEAAATSDLEGAAGVVDCVGDVHGRSLADSLGATAKPAGASAASATVARWRRLRPPRPWSSRQRRLRPRDLRPDRLEPPRLRQLLLPRLPAHRPCAEGITGFSRVPDPRMHAASGFRFVREGGATRNHRSRFAPLTVRRWPLDLILSAGPWRMTGSATATYCRGAMEIAGGWGA